MFKAQRPAGTKQKKEVPIAVLAILGIAVHLVMKFATDAPPGDVARPLLVTLALGGVPLVIELLLKVYRGEYGSDLLAGLSIITSVLLGEYLAGAIVVLMLSGGESIENFAVGRASTVLKALAKRMPSVAHRKTSNGLEEIALDEIRIGDTLVILPHEVCPVDGVVIEGHGVMDESYLTGEPYLMSKTPGARVISGAINGETALTIRAEKRAIDSRYAKIMEVMRESEQRRPRIRRLGDQLGAIYTPMAVAIAVFAYLISGDPVRFLAVLVVATPCPLLIAIPVAIIGSISVAARRGIIVRNPASLELVDTCRNIIFDKTGTLTLGQPQLNEQIPLGRWPADELLCLVASLEQYSKHPLAVAILDAARKAHCRYRDVQSISEPPGQGMRGAIDDMSIEITSRTRLSERRPDLAQRLPPITGGLECVILINDELAGLCRFRDEARPDGRPFIEHLQPHHRMSRVMVVSGDRESEVRYLAERVGIKEVYFGQSPEQKVEIVRRVMQEGPTIFVGDGINDAPALAAATVGLAFGQNSEVTSEAADAVIMDSTLKKIDEFLHLGHRMRRIALESAVGGMALSILGMLIATGGYLPPVAGAVAQEIIDVAAVLNALRAAFLPRSLSDF